MPNSLSHTLEAERIKPLHHFGVAITRPVDQATKLSAMIAESGGAPHLFPLISIAALDDYREFGQQLNTLAEHDWAIFISSNAVQNAMPRLLNQLGGIPQHLKFAAIGPVTATELADFGVQNVLIPEGRFDSESLLSLPQMQAMQGQKVMIFRGVGGREVLADTLKSRGAQVSFAECYQRVNPQQNTDALNALWQNDQLHAIVVTSSEAMRYLLDLAGQQAWLNQVILCVNHARIAEHALPLGLKVAVAQAPGDAAMLQCLIGALSHESI